MEIEIVLSLLLSGLIVGFINTLAGGGTVISMAVFMWCGMPIIEAAGTNRIAVLMQNLVSTLVFRRQKMVDIRQATKLSIPVLIGTAIGAQFTMLITNGLYSVIFLFGLLFLGAMLVLKPKMWNNNDTTEIRSTTVALWITLFVTGVYSGSIYVGVGYIFIAVFAVGYGYDLIRANALKGFMALILTPISLVLFIMHDQVNFKFGLVHGIGNIVGAYIGSKYAKQLGVPFIKKVLIIMLIISMIDLVQKPFFIEYVTNLF